jgi:hypothetical protein
MLLEIYLNLFLNVIFKQLIKINEIYYSKELGFFLAFNDCDSNITEVKKSRTMDNVNDSYRIILNFIIFFCFFHIIKILFRTVSGVFDKITSTTAALTSNRKNDDGNTNINTNSLTNQNSILLDTGKLKLRFQFQNHVSLQFKQKQKKTIKTD